MAAGDTHIADLVDTVHHKIDSKVHSHHVYKSVWSPVIRQRITRPREGACQPVHMIDLQYVALIKDSWILSLSEIYSRIT